MAKFSAEQEADEPNDAFIRSTVVMSCKGQRPMDIYIGGVVAMTVRAKATITQEYVDETLAHYEAQLALAKVTP